MDTSCVGLLAASWPGASVSESTSGEQLGRGSEIESIRNAINVTPHEFLDITSTTYSYYTMVVDRSGAICQAKAAG
jgi:hypothetical protein